MQTNQIPDAPWPQVNVYALIPFDALSFGAFFASFEAQPSYVPDLLKATIHHQNNPRDVQVAYEMHLPWPLANAVYIHGHHLSWPAPNELKIQWYLVESSVAEAVSGHAHFIARDDKTLWHYQTFVRPKSSLAGLFEGSMKNDVVTSLKATLKAYEQLKKDNPEKLEAMIDAWRSRFPNSTK